MNNIPTVALVGRVNVGKSTLFNKLAGERKALESPVAGTTRDYNQTAIAWRDCVFSLIDTGGFLNGKTKDDIAAATLQAALEQAKRSDLILFVIDHKEGLTPYDKQLYKKILTFNRPTVVIANKVDKTTEQESSVLQLAELGAEFIMSTSAATGRGTGDLLDKICKLLPTPEGETPELPKLPQADIHLAIVGQPNVGKSSLLNSLAKEERAIVSSTAHTTRDTNDVFIEHDGRSIQIIDTAGIRRKKKIGDIVEKFSIDVTLRNLRKSEIALLVLDISKPITHQDKHLAERIIETGNSVIIIANKWDLIPDKETNTINEYTSYIRAHLPFLEWAPIIFTSAQKNQRVENILDVANQVWQERFREITDNALDKFIKSAIRKHKPSRGKGVAHPYVYRLRQTGKNPPAFELTIKYKKSLHESYVRFIKNQLREHFGFDGTPIKIYVTSLK